MQKAEESGTDLAQALLKRQRQKEKQTSSQAKSGGGSPLCSVLSTSTFVMCSTPKHSTRFSTLQDS